MDGVVPVSKTFDSIGVMTKCVQDLANVLDVIVGRSRTAIPKGGYTSDLDVGWENLRVGFLDPEKWFLPAFAAKPNPKAQEQIVCLVASATRNPYLLTLLRIERQGRHTRRYVV
jgi:amidase